MFKRRVGAFGASVMLITALSMVMPASAMMPGHIHRFTYRGNSHIGVGVGDAIETHVRAKLTCDDRTGAFTATVKNLVPIAADGITPFNTTGGPHQFDGSHGFYLTFRATVGNSSTASWILLTQDPKTGLLGGTRTITFLDSPDGLKYCASGVPVEMYAGRLEPVYQDNLKDYDAVGSLS